MRLIICRTRQVVGCNRIHGWHTYFWHNGFQCRTRQVVGCNYYLAYITNDIIVSMPHAAGGRLQLYLLVLIGEIVLVFQCRTRQVVGCNGFDYTDGLGHTNCFNAARGRWSVATKQSQFITAIHYFRFNAARGRWSVATLLEASTVLELMVSMPHAAGGRLQQVKTCRQNYLAACFNAARGRWSVAT